MNLQATQNSGSVYFANWNFFLLHSQDHIYKFHDQNMLNKLIFSHGLGNRHLRVESRNVIFREGIRSINDERSKWEVREILLV